jgi:integrase
MRKSPANWPRYMLAKRLKDDRIAYYWSPHKRDYKSGCTMRREALGADYAAAINRAGLLNKYLDAWRQGRSDVKSLDTGTRFGSLAWLFERYRRSSAFERVSERSRPEYRRALDRIENLNTKTGGRVADLPAISITPAAVDKLYAMLQNGPRGKRVRQANLSIDIARRAWDIIHRTHPSSVPTENPWRGVLRTTSKKAKPAASRAEAYALAYKLRDLGEPHLGAAALICFEWLQRPENVLDGKITWADYRPADRPQHVRVFHHKTNEVVWMPLEDDTGRLYPEIDAYLASLPRLGVPIVLTSGGRGPARPYAHVYAQRRVREARAAAKLGSHVTLDACRHGGMTELGDADLTEQGVMTLSGHKTPQAARLYIKRTERQRSSAARKRREWVDANEPRAKVRIRRQRRSQNESETPS